MYMYLFNVPIALLKMTQHILVNVNRCKYQDFI